MRKVLSLLCGFILTLHNEKIRKLANQKIDKLANRKINDEDIYLFTDTHNKLANRLQQ